LCWQTVEQQSIPALAIASAVGNNFKKNRKMTRKLYILFFIPVLMILSCSLTSENKKTETFVFDNEKILTVEQSRQLDSIYRGHEKRTTNEIVLVTTPDY
jgi:uncharacterized membrane protein YgcG